MFACWFAFVYGDWNSKNHFPKGVTSNYPSSDQITFSFCEISLVDHGFSHFPITNLPWRLFLKPFRYSSCDILMLIVSPFMIETNSCENLISSFPLVATSKKVMCLIITLFPSSKVLWIVLFSCSMHFHA